MRTRMARRGLILLLLSLVALCLRASAQTGLQFRISFPPTAHAEPITGRVYVIAAGRDRPEPRLQIGWWTNQTPFFGVDISQLKPGEKAVINDKAAGYPLRSLADLPEGDYYVQALINIYTEFHRADGHTIWAHMDQGEGQQFNVSPGNLYSEVQRVHLSPQSAGVIDISAAQIIPPVRAPQDTAWLKHIKLQSKLLTQFWGRPIFLGATVLLPKDYDRHPNLHYPVIYDQYHFSLDPPLFIRIDQDGEDHQGSQSFRQWSGPSFPRMIAVTFQHPTPFFDDSYAVNSANNGPYGDAIMQELIPYIEEHFRIIRAPWARVLTGVSTGGWESLALQLYHPEFFGGTWSIAPDPIDFRYTQLVNIYEDESAFEAPGFQYEPRERPLMRTVEGQVIVTVRQMSQLEKALGSHGRSGQQLEAWEAVYGPVGEDGYPKPLWDKDTGKIDHSVANYMRQHGYDLREYAERNWSRIGPHLVSKIHVYCGDMDNFYLNLAVYKMEAFLKSTRRPAAQATFQYGRPLKGHGWSPYSVPQLIKAMADHITRHAPPGADVSGWKY
jgi:S-formylglutathione hydrolase FrmB